LKNVGLNLRVIWELKWINAYFRKPKKKKHII
jgi:hypothetical protein